MVLVSVLPAEQSYQESYQELQRVRYQESVQDFLVVLWVSILPAEQTDHDSKQCVQEVLFIRV